MLALLVGLAFGEPAITAARILPPGQKPPAPEKNAQELVLSWPYCPAHAPCIQEVWAEVSVSVAAYTERRNHPHDSLQGIVDQSEEDLAPLVAALEDFYRAQGITDDAARLGHAQGLVQAVQYRYDTETGWTEFPKFALEFLFDQQGDCDDAAIAEGVLLEGLGYEAWFVHWESRGPLTSGHMSTGVGLDREGVKAIKPAGPYVQIPGGPKLLHVDAVGQIGGCTTACTRLGWNAWHDKGIFEASGARVSSTSLDTELPLKAWDNDGDQFTGRKHRRPGEELSPEEKARLEGWGEDWDARNAERLRRLQLEERRKAWEESGELDDQQALVLSAGIGGTVLLLGLGGGLAELRRRRRLARRRAEQATRNAGRWD